MERAVWMGMGWALVTGAAPSALWASGGGMELESGFTLAMRFVNFALLAVLLYYLLNKPIRNFLNQRQQGVRESLDEAEKAKAEAAVRYKEMERRLAQAQKEIEELKQMLLDQGRREKEKILASAQAEAEKIRRQAEATAAQELKQAQHMLRGEAVELAARMAEGILRKGIGPKDHERLVQEYVDTVGKSVR
jgi:F-type H+-transporting ATPase subunit b